MALGFKNCCDSNEYFYLTGIPGYVSEFEIYYIETLEGEIFCGEYVEIPALNYQPTTYNLIGMTGQTSCSACILLNPCPTGITVDLNSQFSTTALVNDCALKTIFPMEVTCVKTLPSETDSLDGQVGLYIVGGTPPYSIFTGTSTTAVGQSTNGQTFQVYNSVSAGTYTSTVYDFYGDYVQTVSCVLSGVPISIIANCSSISPTYYGGNNGSFYITIDGGTQPFTYTFSGVTTTGNDSFSKAGLTAGTYTIVVTDGGEGIFQQTETVTCTVSNPAPIVYPTDLCLTFELCGTPIFLNFTSGSTQNYHPVYSLVNISDIGVTGMTLYYGTDGWFSSIENQDPFSVATDCQIGIISFTKNPNTSDDQPTGIWIGGGIGDIVGVSANVLEGSCSSNNMVNLVNLHVQSNGYCNLLQNAGSATLIADSINGGPFTYYLNNVQISSNIIFGLSYGSYVAQAVDSNGLTSNPVTFTIEEIPLSMISSNSVVDFNYMLGPFYYDYTIVVTYPELLNNDTITTKLSFNPIFKKLSNQSGDNISYTYDINVQKQNSVNYSTSQIPMSQISNTITSESNPCFSSNENFSWLSDNEFTIYSADILLIHVRFNVLFGLLPIVPSCIEQMSIYSTLSYVNPILSQGGCSYLSQSFNSYIFKISPLTIQRYPYSSSVGFGYTVENNYGPQ